jgi:arylsulfatase A-like enzyme
MTRRELLISGLAAWQVRALPQSTAANRLNVLLILVDDWGATDLGCGGSTFYETPNIDKLAASGMRFTQGYSACTVCSPSRAAILTGKYPARLHLTDWIAGHNYPWARLRPPAWTQYLPLEETTLAEALKPAGYRSASIGKWHLTPTSSDAPKFYPEHQGFDQNFGGTFRGQPPSYFSPYGIETLKDGPPGEYLTDREEQEAARFITAAPAKPFFLYLPHHTVHTPIQAKKDTIERFRQKAHPDALQHNPAYAAMISSLDENVGKLLRTLEETGVADRTVVILTGDNGGWLPSTNTNLGMRAGKGSVYEGGVRVPFIVRWPGVTTPGSTCDVPVMGLDLFPTILQITGQTTTGQRTVDGVSLVPLLKGAGKSPGWRRTDLFWHYPHYHPGGATPYTAIRSADWKLIEFLEDNRCELYNLKNDPEESKDLAQSQPSRVNDLRKRIQAWRTRVGAQMPVTNSAYDPKRERERATPATTAARTGGE